MNGLTKIEQTLVGALAGGLAVALGVFGLAVMNSSGKTAPYGPDVTVPADLAPLDQLLLYEGPHSVEVEDPSNGVKTRRDVRIQPGKTVSVAPGPAANRAGPTPPR